MRRSGRSRPSSWRIGRLSQGSERGSGGQTPSTRPPSTIRSTLCKARFERPENADAHVRSGRRTTRSAMRGLKQLGIVGGAMSMDAEPASMSSRAPAMSPRQAARAPPRPRGATRPASAKGICVSDRGQRRQRLRQRRRSAPPAASRFRPSRPPARIAADAVARVRRGGGRAPAHRPATPGLRPRTAQHAPVPAPRRHPDRTG